MSDEPRGFIGFEVAHYCDATCYATGCTNRGPILLYERAFTMLRRLEWAGGEMRTIGNTSTFYDCCPVCYAHRTTDRASESKHEPACDLATLLRDLP